MLRLQLYFRKSSYVRLKEFALAMILVVMPLHSSPANVVENLFQFTAEGHVLGFESDGFYVVSGDHMLHVDFLGTEGATPESAGMGSKYSQVPPLTAITYTDLWPRVSLTYEALEDGIARSTWRLEPGAEVKDIQLQYSAPLEYQQDGSLKMHYETGWLLETAPIAWQEVEGERMPVEVAFRLNEAPGRNPVIGFEVANFDPAYPLLIDPVLRWNTFWGRSSLNGSPTSDTSLAIAVDGRGYVYVAGYTQPRSGSNSSHDAFIAKLNPDGALLWDQFLGGFGTDYGAAIAVDGSSNVYISGFSTSSWGTPVNAHSGWYDAFAAKLNPDGTLLWNTFMGSSQRDLSDSIVVDRGGNVFVAGDSQSTWGSPVNPHSEALYTTDVFVTKLNSDGSLVWNTFMGPAKGGEIDLDHSGNVYAAGKGSSHPPFGSVGSGAFVAKLNSNTGVRQWNTFMDAHLKSGWCGPMGDSCVAIAVDGSGNVYVAGTSETTWGAPVNAHASGNDAFAAKLNPDGTLLWNTFMGSSADDIGTTVAVGDSDQVYVAGRSVSTWGVPMNVHAGGWDGFVSRLNSSGDRRWHTFLGSESYDNNWGVAVGSNSDVFVAGQSNESWGVPVNDHTGGSDAFAAKLFDDGDSCTYFAIKPKNGSVALICL